MLQALSQRLLPVLQLTRMALVFTAIADSTCGLLMHYARLRRDIGGSILDLLDRRLLIATALVSFGLYGYGMSLNDIIDRRRDSQLASHRPLPSGRIGVLTAHLICGLLGLAALAGGFYFAYANALNGWVTFAMVVWTGLLITFYDFAGKYLVWPGLICLGLIRFFHAVIPAPELPLLWHPLLLLNHVVILSTVAYAWEQKRPALNRAHVWAVAAMLFLINGLAIGLCAALRPRTLWIGPGLMLPAAAVLLFIALAVALRVRISNERQAGQKLMLYGLMWLIVYDAAFAAAFVGWLSGGLILSLLPIAYLAVQLMRWWSKMLEASQRPEYRRAGV